MLLGFTMGKVYFPLHISSPGGWCISNSCQSRLGALSHQHLSALTNLPVSIQVLLVLPSSHSLPWRKTVQGSKPSWFWQGYAARVGLLPGEVSTTPKKRGTRTVRAGSGLADPARWLGHVCMQRTHSTCAGTLDPLHHDEEYSVQPQNSSTLFSFSFPHKLVHPCLHSHTSSFYLLPFFYSIQHFFASIYLLLCCAVDLKESA